MKFKDLVDAAEALDKMGASEEGRSVIVESYDLASIAMSCQSGQYKDCQCDCIMACVGRVGDLVGFTLIIDEEYQSTKKLDPNKKTFDFREKKYQYS